MNSPFPDPARSRAVLIGVAAYEKLPDLPSVDNNVSKLKELLMDDDLWGLPEEHCVALSGPKAVSAPSVMQTLHTMAEEATDAFLVYFAGHGLSPLKFGLHLALPGADTERLYNALDFNHIRHTLMEVCTARQRLVILDCCYAGRVFGDHLGPTNEELADLAGIKGTYLLTAASATARALAPKGEPYTAFTGEVIKALDEGIPDGPDLLDTDAFFRHVRRELIAKGRPEPQQRADHFGHRIVLAHNRWDQPVGPEAAAYAQALREAVRPLLDDDGGTAGLGRALALPPAQVKRYLKGGRIAPKDVLDALADFVDASGRPLPAGEPDRLHTLRRAAQRASKDTDTQLLYWREEADRLKTELSDLTQELDESAALKDRDRLLRQLEHARRYIKLTEGELTAERETVHQLRREVAVLRVQARRLLTPEPTAQAVVTDEGPVEGQAEVRAEGRAEGRAESGDHAVVTLAMDPGPSTTSETGADTDTDAGADADAGSESGSGSGDETDDDDDTDGDAETAPALYPQDPLGIGCLIGLLCLPVAIYLVVGLFISLGTVGLEPSGGRRPTAAGNAYTWDVAGRVESVFAPEENIPTDRLQGTLRLMAGSDCGGKPVEVAWEIALDGRRFKQGTVRDDGGSGSGTQVATGFLLKSSVDTVTLSVDPTGAAGTCDRYTLVWEKPALSKRYDPFYAF
ncbi:caspase family protein [Streptomyces sp. NPDC059002]|uniref:caspase, EACC1-associated type n=1 Tax=Streptomyces sp. NPDC059002 TaxID=3346690 RepID=UPI0036C670DA